MNPINYIRNQRKRRIIIQITQIIQIIQEDFHHINNLIIIMMICISIIIIKQLVIRMIMNITTNQELTYQTPQELIIIQQILFK